MSELPLLDYAERAPKPASDYPVDKRGNPIPADVCDLFEELALRIRGKNWERYSADAVLHQIRWHHRIERGNRAFLANDHWTAPLARWFLARHPECPKFFELRERVDEGYSVDQ